MTVKFDGELEIDRTRGVIYFHHGKTGRTLMRICQLPTPIPTPITKVKGGTSEMLDITHMHGVSWALKEEPLSKTRLKQNEDEQKVRIVREDEQNRVE